MTFLKKADIVLPEMKTYKIGVVWQMYGYVEVEANSLWDAVNQVDDGASLPDNGEYIEGSLVVAVEGSALNEEN